MHEKPAASPTLHQEPVAAGPDQQPNPLALLPVLQEVMSPLPFVHQPAPRCTAPNRITVGV
jgi:hypothetical protein